MSTGRPPPGTIPTLTEIVPWPATPPVKAPVEPETQPEQEPEAAPEAPAPLPAAGGEAAVDETLLVQRVLADIEKQVDLMLDVRLREALAPVLARATDALVRDARKELTAALRDVVARSVARELGRGD